MNFKLWIRVAILAIAASAGTYGYLRYTAPAEIVNAATTACDKHSVNQCPFCSPEVFEAMGFCNGHGVPEAICTRCRNDLEEAFRSENDWCQGHGLPESQCAKCNPGVLDKWKDFSKPKPTSNSFFPIPDRLQVTAFSSARIHQQPALSCETEQNVIRLSSRWTAKSAGLDFAPVEIRKLRESLEAPAEIQYDAQRHARLAPRASGVVTEVRIDLGQQVMAGDVIAVVDSAALGSAKSALLQASARAQLWEKNSTRENLLLEKKLSTQKDALEAETKLMESRIDLQAAEQRLQNLGLSKEQVKGVREQGDTSSLLYLTAPFDGVVIEIDAVIGEQASEETILVSIADTSKMWAMLDVDASEIRKVAKGQPVLLTVDGQMDQTLGGLVTWISTSVDPRTRTIKVRAEFDNSDGSLRARGFGIGRIITRDDSAAVLIPKESVQWEGCCNIAFVRRSATEFVPRKLFLGYDAGEYIEVLRGLQGDEQVVTQGSFLLKTELKKDSIGAGCCEVDHLSQ
ncbi:MAG: efflux RND transporter periplasmic adaptor subunit [Planctomycetes bacterium]|jgi:cobalt-zinc-cadmium efflux system membrane fusion protein|nr:efflux RND transporter periplasmic adaptor subunit [Planctomycetota bacterium]MCP4862245.1 efflux RND transporter periplasmic adaptor subunit [Planctomycetota bacterium]|tara:strand:+ start:2354 stop:3895 length:1542 start_codon:yes stop_codon:yes gene_type:complete